MSDCPQIQHLLAAHAFGALDPDEQQLVESHLERCPSCGAAYARLSELPGLLDLAGGTETRIAAPPALLEASVLGALPPPGRPRARPRRGPAIRDRGGRRVLGAALVAALVLGAVVVPQILNRAGDQAVPRLTLAAVPQEPGARAVVELRAHPWGTEVDLQAQHLAPTRGAQIYEVWFVSPHGRVSAGTFTVGAQGSVAVRLAAAARPSQYESIGITREPDGLSPARRGPNVLHVPLPA